MIIIVKANEKNHSESSAAYHGFKPLDSQVKYYKEHGEYTAKKADDADIEAIVAEVTKRVMEKYGK